MCLWPVLPPPGPRSREEGTSGELDARGGTGVGVGVAQWLVWDRASSFLKFLLWRPYAHGDLTRIQRIVRVRVPEGWSIPTGHRHEE